MVNLLAAKVPHIELKGPLCSIGKLMAVDVDALGGFVFRRQRPISLVQPAQQTGFTRTSIPKDQHLGFIEVVFSLRFYFAQIVENGFLASFNDLRGRMDQGAVVDIDSIPKSKLLPLRLQASLQ